MSGDVMPGFMVPLGFHMRPAKDEGLSREARERVLRKIEDVEAARRHALATSHSYVIGGGP